MGENILRIIFNKSTSQYYDTVIKLAKKFDDYKQDEKTNIISISVQELNKKRTIVQGIINYVITWKYTSLSFNDKPIDLTGIHRLSQILNCSNEYDNVFNKDSHCYIDNQFIEGWRCKYISDIKRHIPNDIWDYNRNHGKYWFDYGKFDDNGNWIIDKKSLENAISKEVDEKNVFICPYYSENNIKNIINDLPNIIDLNNNEEWVINEKDVDNGYTLEKKKIGILPKKLVENNKNSNGTFIGLRILPEEKKDEEDIENSRNIPKVTFNEIGGLGNTLIKIREMIELPMKSPELFVYLGIIPHKGILLFGPPGCGKTLIAKAIAHEIDAHFIDIKGPELFSKWVGQSFENLRKKFEEARELQPSIIFFDEIDAVAQRRSGAEGERHDAQFVNQLLTLMDGIEDYGNIRIIASTNRPELLDEALLRPGRIDYQLEIAKPTLQGCKEIFSIYAKKMPIDNKFNMELFSEKLLGCTGADIAFIIRESAYNCIRRNINIEEVITKEQDVNYETLIIDENDFEFALKMIKGNSK